MKQLHACRYCISCAGCPAVLEVAATYPVEAKGEARRLGWRGHHILLGDPDRRRVWLCPNCTARHLAGEL